MTLRDGGQQEWRGRNNRGEGQSGSLSGYVCREGGVSVGRGTGALAWALVEPLFFTWMIITQVSALYFAGKLYLTFRYFPVLTGMV